MHQQRLSTYLAIAIGLVIVLLCLVFALTIGVS